MGRPVCEVYKARNEAIVKAYVEDQASLDDLREDYGLTKTRLREILETQGIELRHETRTPQLSRRPRNTIFIAIGARLHADRMKRNCSLAEYAVHLGLSESRLSNALQGLHDWRLMELIRAAKALDLSLEGFTQTSGL